MRNYWLFGASVAIVLCSCNNQDKRLEAIEREFGIQLPEEYDVVQDTDISYSDFESDYRQTMVLQFGQKEFTELTKQIERSPYFGQLKSYDGESPSLPERGIPYEQQEVMDSLTKCGRSGVWIKKENEYRYIDFFDWKDFCQGTLDTRNRTLKYIHDHL